MSDPVVVDHVTKRFAGHTAVDSLSLTVPSGIIYGLLGPNGAGKTTTIRMLMDIYEPDEGSVRVLGTSAGGRAHSERIGYLPEERGLYPKMRVLDVLVFLAEAKGVSRRSARAKALDWLDRLGLGDWRLRKVSELSKGMQQKVQFISTVLHDPDLVILDEPFSGLDPVNSQVLRDTVVDYRRHGKTVLFSTHIMEHAEKICDRLCIIARGKKLIDGTRDDTQPVANLLRMLHDVRRKQHGLAATAELQDGLAQHLRIHGIETGERLVENDQVGIVQDGGDELHLLLHALRKIRDLAHAPVRESQLLEPLE